MYWYKLKKNVSGVVIHNSPNPSGANPIHAVAHLISDGNNHMETITPATDSINPNRNDNPAIAAREQLILELILLNEKTT